MAVTIYLSVTPSHYHSIIAWLLHESYDLVRQSNAIYYNYNYHQREYDAERMTVACKDVLGCYS